ncbi:MAG: hypothetical protein WD871_03230 [Xanthobacteraceae bacterium]
MTTPNSIESQDTSLARDWLNAARFHLASRRGLLAVAAAAIVAGLAFNWNWLVATGVAPILIALLPCAVMCGLGLCFHKLFGGADSTQRSSPTVAADPTAELSARQERADSIIAAPDCCGDATDAAAPVQSKSNPDDERRDSHA